MNRKNILLELFSIFFKIGVFTFGGGYAMISLIDRECVDNKQWITSDELMNITAISESTPGPIAINCATYTGYKMKGLLGAIIVILGMILPSTIIIYTVSVFFEDLMSYPIIPNGFKGIRVAVSILIVQAALKTIKKAVKNSEKKLLPTILISSFFSIALICNLLGIHFSTIYLILVSGFIGYFIYGKKPSKNMGDAK